MIEEATSKDQAASEWRRLHPLSPLLQGGLTFVIIVGIIFANLRDRIVWMFLPNEWAGDEAGQWEGNDPIDSIIENGLLLLAVAIIFGIVLLVALTTWLSWRFHSFRITAEAVETRKGILFRQSRRAPLERIQSVNLQRPLLARMLGLTRIDVKTGGQGGNAVLSYLANADAKKVRDEILRSAAPEAAVPSTDYATAIETPQLQRRLEEIADEDIEPWAQDSIVRVPTGRLLASTLLSNEAIIFITLSAAVPIAAMFWGWGILAALIPGVIALFGVSFSRFNKGFRFTISETANGVRTGSGLTATSTETIPRHRIHAIDVLQPLGWRLFGWWRVRVTTAGTASNSGSSNQSMFQNILLPVGGVDEVMRVLTLLLPEVVDEEEKTALAEALLHSNEGYTKAPKRAWFVLLFGRARAGIQLRKFAQHHAQVRIRRGFFTRHLIIMPLSRAQSVLFARPFVHYMLGLASLHVHTVMGAVIVTARGIEKETALELFFEIEREILRSQYSTLDRSGDESR